MSKDSEDSVDQSMPRETVRPAKTVDMIVHKRVCFVEATVEVVEV